MHFQQLAGVEIWPLDHHKDHHQLMKMEILLGLKVMTQTNKMLNPLVGVWLWMAIQRIQRVRETL